MKRKPICEICGEQVRMTIKNEFGSFCCAGCILGIKK
jgi:endogenous inhibitor of DNA gyrase (YacG/DUF329 family)